MYWQHWRFICSTYTVLGNLSPNIATILWPSSTGLFANLNVHIEVKLCVSSFKNRGWEVCMLLGLNVCFHNPELRCAVLHRRGLLSLYYISISFYSMNIGWHWVTASRTKNRKAPHGYGNRMGKFVLQTQTQIFKNLFSTGFSLNIDRKLRNQGLSCVFRSTLQI